MSSLSKGQFRLYDRADPALKPGDYAVTADQAVTADRKLVSLFDRADPALKPWDYTVTADQKVDGTSISAVTGSWTLRVQGPRFRLPPSEVLGVFPAAEARDCSVQQLPHMVLSSRTLPWARSTTAGQPWMALLLFKKDEVTLHTDSNIGEFVKGTGKTASQWFPGIPSGMDGEPLTWVDVRRSVLRHVLPLRDTELPLLAHVREVSTHDTEGAADDDGFVAMLISNRLPNATNTDYVAVLVNLEPWLNDSSFWPTRSEADTLPSTTGSTVNVPPASDPIAKTE